MSGLRKRAKVLSDAQVRAVLNHVASTRYPKRDRAMVLLSMKAGLRAKEITELDWPMVLTSEAVLADSIALENRASKGKHGGRVIPIHPDLSEALQALLDEGPATGPGARVIQSERSDCPERGMAAGSVATWFHDLYRTLGFAGASSHSGRRGFITKAARKITEAGGSLRDVQALAGHASLSTTQGYIEQSEEAKSRVVRML